MEGGQGGNEVMLGAMPGRFGGHVVGEAVIAAEHHQQTTN